MRKVNAIQYKHFVRTIQECELENCPIEGGVKFDTGGWRDKGLGNKRGIEFELLADAEFFMEKHGGEYSERTTTQGN